MRIVALLFDFMIRLYNTMSAIFFDCKFSLFLKDPFSQIVQKEYVPNIILNFDEWFKKGC